MVVDPPIASIPYIITDIDVNSFMAAEPCHTELAAANTSFMAIASAFAANTTLAFTIERTSAGLEQQLRRSECQLPVSHTRPLCFGLQFVDWRR